MPIRLDDGRHAAADVVVIEEILILPHVRRGRVIIIVKALAGNDGAREVEDILGQHIAVIVLRIDLRFCFSHSNLIIILIFKDENIQSNKC